MTMSPNPSFASDRPRPPSDASPRGLLTTGLVGGWLTAASWATFTVVIVVAALMGAGGQRDQGLFDFAMGAGVLAFLAMLTWLAGMVCTSVGWFGMAKLHPGVAGVLAWLSIVVTACALILPFLGAAMNVSGAYIIVVLGGLVTVAFYVLHASFWAQRGRARGAARIAVVGSIIAALACLVVTIAVLTRSQPDSVFMLFVVIAAPFSAFLAHLGAGLATGQERETASALSSFD
ncbi:MAG: hypothetical protein U1F43_28340 [Myxococcota bacterium]